MALTEVENILIGYLKLSPLGRREITIIMLQLTDPGAQYAMCKYLHDNPDATGPQIVAVANRMAEIQERLTSSN